MGIEKFFKGVFTPLKEDREKIEKEKNELGLNSEEQSPTEKDFAEANERLKIEREEKKNNESEIKEAA